MNETDGSVALGDRNLIVTDLRPLAVIGNGSTLYSVRATDPEGVLVDLPWRTFQELELNKETVFEVRRHWTQRHGTTYTLIPKERKSATRELAERVKELEERFNGLENNLDQWIDERVKEQLDARLPKAF